MSELRERIAEVLGRPQLAGLATITDDGKPWVRYVMIMTGDDLVIRLATFRAARKVGQIEKTPDAHLMCGVTDPEKMAPYLQIQGRARLNVSEEARHAFWNDTLTQIFEGPDDPKYGVIEVVPSRIEYWAPGEFEPEVWTAA